jgi:hypothetical protein
MGFERNAIISISIKAPVSTVVPRLIFTNNPSHLFQIKPLHVRPSRNQRPRPKPHPTAYRWPNGRPVMDPLGPKPADHCSRPGMARRLADRAGPAR